MDFRHIRESIIREEMEHPKRFAHYEEREYGLLFYDDDNQMSGDSNHAVIYPERITDLRAVLRDIAAFCDSKAMQRYDIYPPFVEDYFINNAKAFKACGYEFTVGPDVPIMLLTEKSTIDLPQRLDIQRIHEWNDAIARDVLACVANKEHFMTVLKNSMGENNYLFIGYRSNEAASLLAFHVSAHGVTRFDEMGTAEQHKNNGYAREMNRFAADYVREHNLPIAYQWPAHKLSERITTEAGFRPAFPMPNGFATLAEYR